MQQPTSSETNGGTTGVSGATGIATAAKSHVNGGRFDFDDGGTYCGGWEEGKAHGHGVCTGPKGQGAYSGSWHYGFEVSGVYTWPSGSCFEGQWQNGKRHGLGVETRGRWIYRGEWSQGFKGRYGVRQSNTSTAKYEGTWANGLQDGCGSETYADDGTYQGQWLRGMRHGYGVRNSAPFGKASKYRANKNLRASLTSLRSNEGNPGGGGNPEAVEKRDRRVDDSRGGFVLKSDSSEPAAGGRRRSLGSGNIKKGILMGLKLKKQGSTGDLEKRGGGGSGSIRSTGSSASWLSTDSTQSGMTNNSIPSDSNASFVVEDAQLDPSVKEIYMGEWKNDKRSGFGISERSDGLKYEGEWYANKKYGYGVTTFSNGEKEEGKYKNNVLITSQKKKLFLMRSAKFRDRIDAAVNAAQRASKIALQKADIAISRTATARGKGEQADLASAQARIDSDVAMAVAKQYAPDFKQPGLERLMKMRQKSGQTVDSPVDVNETIGNQVQAGVNAKPPVMQNQQQNYYHQELEQMNTLGNALPPKNNPTSPPMVNSINSAGPGLLNDVMASPTSVNSDVKTNELFNKQNQIQQNQINQNVMMNQVQKTNTMSKSRTSLSGSIDLQSAHPTTTSINNNANSNTLRRGSRRISGDRPYLAGIGQQSSIDHFDHYKRPPSRDSSVDRYSRATGRLSGSMGSRQASVERSSRPSETPDRGVRAPSVVRGSTPAPVGANSNAASAPSKNGSVMTGSGANRFMHNNSPGPPQQPTHQPAFEEIIIRKKGLGQDIIPSPNQPKRTESLFVPGTPVHQQGNKNLVQQNTLQRKKSLPDFQELPKASGAMSREEVSYLGSARREEVRRQYEERERLRANPLLYLVSPQVKDWFTRQQLVIIVLFVNISLAIMFFKLLT